MKTLSVLFALIASTASFADVITLSPGATMQIYSNQHWTISCQGGPANPAPVPTQPNIISCQCASRAFQGTAYPTIVGQVMNPDGNTREVNLGRYEQWDACRTAMAKLAACPK